MTKDKSKIYFRFLLIIIGIFLICFGAGSFYIHSKEVKNIHTTDKESLNAYFKVTKNDEKNNNNLISYMAILDIPKIGLKQGIPFPNSKENNVDRNIMISSESAMPDKENGLIVLSSHSGNSSISYFKNLYKLNIGDSMKIHYNQKIYQYVIDDIYEVDKKGEISVKRDLSKNTVVLVTCTKGSKKMQTVYVAYQK